MNTLYRFINRIKAYISESLAISYFSEMVATYDDDLPLSTDGRVAYFFPQEKAIELGGSNESVLIGYYSKNAFDTLSPIGVPYGGTIVDFTLGENQFEAVLFEPVTAGDFFMDFTTAAYNTKSAFEAYITPKLAATVGQGVVNFVADGTSVYFDLLEGTTFINNAFEDETELVTISDPNGQISALGSMSFKDAIALTSVSLLGVSAVPSYCFSGCTELETANFKSTLNTIGISAFYACEKLNMINFAEILQIGSLAFYNCLTFVSALNMPKVVTIGDSAFSGCANITSMSAAQAQEFGNAVFQNNTALVTISAPLVTTLGNNCFSGCTAATDYTFGSLQTIGNHVFHNNTSLALFEDNSVVTLGNSCFEGNSSLVTVALGAAETIGNHTFKDCDIVERIEIISVTACGANTNNNGVFANCDFPNLTIYINSLISTDADITDAQAAGATIVI